MTPIIRHPLTAVISLLLASFWGAGAHATDLVVDTDTTWPEGTYVYDAVTVTAGATLTCEGEVTLQAASLTVDAGAAISANETGHPSAQGPGAGDRNEGGGHGGRGGASVADQSGSAYGSATFPVTLGSGGGVDAIGRPGGAGGGALFLDIAGTCTIDGSVSSNGGDGAGSSFSGMESGGGAGGSIRINTGEFVGTGSLTANGGGTEHGGDPGGGGRIAVFYTGTWSFTGSTTTEAGTFVHTPPVLPEPGTIGFFDTTHNDFFAGPTWRFQTNDAPFNYRNVSIDGSETLFEADFTVEASGLVSIVGSSTLDAYGESTEVSLSADEFYLEAGSVVTVSTRGYPSAQGPGAGDQNEGGGHGGRGGASVVDQGGGIYGSATSPMTKGSGGGVDAAGRPGGAGGGALFLDITGTCTINGSVSSDGGDGAGSSFTGMESGGGAGGSIRINTGDFAGTGTLTANGGGTTHGGDPGGGGRIAVFYTDAWSFTGSTTTEAGGFVHTPAVLPEPGTVGFFDIDDDDFAAGPTWHFQDRDAPFEFRNMVFSDSTSVFDEGLRVEARETVTIENGSVLTGHQERGHLEITAASLTLGAGASFDVDGQGYPADQGPGAGGWGGGGAGHGGIGATSHGSPGGPAYGSEEWPVDYGSGGGSDSFNSGGAGGGSIRLNISGSFVLDGDLTADGTASNRGGGSGGSILVSAGVLSGSGSLSAIGGVGAHGGGAGGRIAFYNDTHTFTGAVDVSGAGGGSPAGEAGTTRWFSASGLQLDTPIEIDVMPAVFYDFPLHLTSNQIPHLRVRVTPLAGAGPWTLLGRRGGLPNLDNFDWSATQATDDGTFELLIPSPPAGALNFTVLHEDWSGTTARMRIEAITTSRFIAPKSFGRVPIGTQLPVTLNGLGFEPGMTVELRPAGSPTPTTSTPLADWGPTWLTATLDLGAPVVAGDFDLAVVWADMETVVLTNAIEVVDVPQPMISAWFAGPDVMRPGRWYTIEIHYENTSPYTVPAPNFQVRNTQDLPMQVEGGGPAHIGAVQIFGGRRIQAPAKTVGGPEDDRLGGGEMVLSPGEGGMVPISFFTTPGQMGDFEFDLEFFNESTGLLIDWTVFAEQIRPEGTDDASWDRLAPLLEIAIGQSWDDFVRLMRTNATYLELIGKRAASHASLLDLTMDSILGLSHRQVLAVFTDAIVSSPGLPLDFTRVFPNTIPGRCYLGPLGRGWHHSFDVRAEAQTSGNVVVVQGDGSLRHFEIRPDESYEPTLPGDLGRLETAGGGWTLTELDGSMASFDATGRLIAVADLNGNSVTLAYLPSSQLETVTHSSGDFLTLSYNGWGRIETLTDHAGRVTTYTYDTTGEQLVQVVGPGSVTSTYIYRQPGGSSDPRDWALQEVTHPDGSHQYFEYDLQGRLSAEEKDGGEERITYDYSLIGRTAVAGGTGSITTYRDEHGRSVRLRDAVDQNLWFDFDGNGNVSEVVDPSLASWTASHDHLSNATETRDPLGRVERTDHSYPIHGTGLPTRFEDGMGNASYQEYDENDNLTAITYPDESNEQLDRPTSLEVELTNRRGQAILYTTNNRRQVVRKDLPGGAFVIYDYDTVGRLTDITDATGTTTITWDGRDLPTRVDYPDGHWLEYTWNDAAMLTSRLDDDGNLVVHLYDAAGRLEKITDGSTTEFVVYGRDADGRLSDEWRANGTHTTYAWNAAGQLESIVHYSPTASIQERFDYTYDINGLPSTVTSLGGVTTFDHDAVGQLIGVTYPSGRHVGYVYDGAGNRIEVDDDGAVTAYTVNELNQVTAAGVTTFSWDLDGNLASRTDPGGTTIYTWDAENRLTEIVTPSAGTWIFAYDAFDRLAWVTHGGTTHRWVNDLYTASGVAAVWEGSTLVAAYADGIGLAVQRNPGASDAYLAFDAACNARLATDDLGAVAATWDVDPFGVHLGATGTLDLPFIFGGRLGMADHGHGLATTMTRPYDSSLGRFLATEPLRFTSGATLYLYGENSPLRLIDATGLNASDGVAAVGIGGALINAATNGFFGPVISPFTGALKAATGINDYVESTNPYDSVSSVGDTSQGLLTIVTPIVALPLAPVVAITNSITYVGKKAINHYWAESPQTRADSIHVPKNPYKTWGPNPHPDLIDLWKKHHYKLVNPHDPNEKETSAGTGPQQVVQPGQEIHYKVYFENQPSALAPAQEVWVTDQLEPELDWSSFRVTEIGWGDHQVAIPEGTAAFASRETANDYRPGVGKQWWVDVAVTPNLGTGEIEWSFRTLDPDTGMLPGDPYAGFLPPNDSTHRGDGWVGFAVRPNYGLVDGTLVENEATIIFDTQPAIITNTVFNTIGYPVCDPNDDGVVDSADLAEMDRVLTEFGYRPPGLADCDHRDGENVNDLLWLVDWIHR